MIRDNFPNAACGEWINVKAEKLSRDGILESIRHGLFYATQGPEFRTIEIDDGMIRVETTPVKKIAFVSVPFSGICHKVLDSALEGAEYVIRPCDSYIRIQITDAQGRKAWSNPCYQTICD